MLSPHLMMKLLIELNCPRTLRNFKIFNSQGCNGILNKTFKNSSENIAKDLLEMTKTCRGYRVSDIFTSSITCRRNNFINKMVQRVNLLLKPMCEENGNVYKKILKQKTYCKMISIFQNMERLNYLGLLYISPAFIQLYSAFCCLPFYTND